MATTKLWTVEELEREGAPEGRWELIDGELVEMSPSGGRASKIGVRTARLLGNHVEPRALGEIFGADGGFVLFPGRDLLRVADVAFVRAERLPAPEDQFGFLRLAPDLVVEVVSPYDRPGEVAAKTAMWLDAGVRLVWIVDPGARTVTVHALDRPLRTLRDGDDLDGGNVLPDFRVAVAELFV
jgi:Uma2 family endonuclease